MVVVWYVSYQNYTMPYLLHHTIPSYSIRRLTMKRQRQERCGIRNRRLDILVCFLLAVSASLVSHNVALSRRFLLAATKKLSLCGHPEHVAAATTTTLQQSDNPKDNSPETLDVLVCLTDRESVLNALVLAHSLRQDEYHTAKLEIYHPGSLSRYLQAYLESTYASFVTVIDLSRLSSSSSEAATTTHETCVEKALSITHLNNILIADGPLYFLPCNCTVQPPPSQQQQQQHEQQLRGRTPTRHARTTRAKCSPLFPTQCVTWANAGNNFLETLGQLDYRTRHTPMRVATVHGDTRRWMMVAPHASSLPLHQVVHDGSFSWRPGPRDERDEAMVELVMEAAQAFGRAYHRAQRVLWMDRSVDWVAFDAGLHLDKSSTLNTIQAVLDSLDAGATLINLDLAQTRDGALVAVHKNDQITPFSDRVDSLAVISQMDAAQVRQLTNPCVPQAVVKNVFWPDSPKSYHAYRCQSQTMAFFEDIVQALQVYEEQQQRQAGSNMTSSVQLIIDLKAPSIESQLDQVRRITQMSRNLRLFSLYVRFFESHEKLATTVIPEQVLAVLLSEDTSRAWPSTVSYYVNVPSSLACHQFASWVRQYEKAGKNTSSTNGRFLGCFVILNNQDLLADWQEFSQRHGVGRSASQTTATIPFQNSSVISETIVVCDVPRYESMYNPALWDEEYVRCVQEGGVGPMIHDPFPPALNEDTSPPPSLWAAAAERNTMLGHVSNWTGIDDIVQRQMFGSDFSYWSVGTAADEPWEQWYHGRDPLDPNQEVPLELLQKKKTLLPNPMRSFLPFRCITKVISTLLLMKFQEMGFLSIDDFVVDETNKTQSYTYRQLLSNTAGLNGTEIGKEFHYGSDLWAVIPGAFERLTGLDFREAVDYYILWPSGMKGYYDLDTKMTPWAGRGFVGPANTLAILGGILANRGVSQKTRRQIVSAESVDQMLANVIVTPSLNASYFRDPTFLAVESKFNLEGEFPNHFTNGYGLAVWHVSGWRHSAQGQPINGWLIQGIGMIYVDTTGLVVSFYQENHFGHTVIALRRIVRDTGDFLLGKEIILDDPPDCTSEIERIRNPKCPSLRELLKGEAR